jgi:hypothetical protein
VFVAEGSVNLREDLMRNFEGEGDGDEKLLKLELKRGKRVSMAETGEAHIR